LTALLKFEYGDPADIVEYSRVEGIKQEHGCAACAFRMRQWQGRTISLARRCSLGNHPKEGKKYCKAFELDERFINIGE
jgi:hypothetical protein